MVAGEEHVLAHLRVLSRHQRRGLEGQRVRDVVADQQLPGAGVDVPELPELPAYVGLGGVGHPVEHDRRLRAALKSLAGLAQIREAKGMKLKLLLDDVRINPTAESAGTLGSLDADVTWSAQGIKDTVQGIIPVLGNLVSGVTPDPSTGTLELEGPLGTVTILPQVADGGLSLQVVKVTGLGFTLPRETVQPALDAFTSTLTANLPMGIHADSVSVTDTGVSAKFIARDATIPNGAQDPCFAGI